MIFLYFIVVIGIIWIVLELIESFLKLHEQLADVVASQKDVIFDHVTCIVKQQNEINDLKSRLDKLEKDKHE